MVIAEHARARILNWEHFMPVAELLIAQARRGQRPLSVLSLSFHQRSARAGATLVEPATHGAVVDQLLSEILEVVVRDSDLIGRSGPTHYQILATDTPRLGAMQFATRIRTMVTAKLPPSITAGRCISIGIATGPDNGSTVEELVLNAESALAEAVAAGGDRARLYNWDGPEGFLNWEVEQDRLATRRRAAISYLSGAARSGSIDDVALQVEEGACPNCRDAAREVYPLNAVPPLPLAGCTSSRGCHCNYTSPALARAVLLPPVAEEDARALDLPRRFRDCAQAGIDPRRRCNPVHLAEYLEAFPLLSFAPPELGIREPVLLQRTGQQAWERVTPVARAVPGLLVPLELPLTSWIHSLPEPPPISDKALYDERWATFHVTEQELIITSASARETIPLLNITGVYYLRGAVACSLAGRDDRLVIRVRDPLLAALYLARILRMAMFQR